MVTALGDRGNHLSLDWLYLYIGTWFCLIGLVVTRHAYKLSPGFRSRLEALGFYKLKVESTMEEKASVMMAVLCEAWPSTVSEMLEDTETAHGMVFKSLMITGCLIVMMCDFAALSPSTSGMPTAAAITIAVVHLLRRIVFAIAVGFCFAPSTGHDHGIGSVRQVTTTPVSADDSSRSERLSSKVPLLKNVSVKKLPAEERAQMARTVIVGSVHVILASGILSILPVLELLAVCGEAYICASHHISQARSLDPCGIAWCAIALLRLFHIFAIQMCMSVFFFHFSLGFVSPARHHSFKGFWAEFTACRLFAQLMILAAIQSWFTEQKPFDALPFALRILVLVVAALHVVYCFWFCAPNALLILRNVEFSEVQLAGMFERGRSQDSVVQLLLDAQLAFVGCVQSELGIHERDDTGSKAPVRKWLFQQFKILFKLFGKDDAPMYPSRKPSKAGQIAKPVDANPAPEVAAEDEPAKKSRKIK